MPTGENIEPAGGRVTRSLRKRLTSIDSDLSSRPGTPNNINLQTIPETNTPKKRVTRRASLNTPSAMTPTKESTITPGRRLTRRSSVNFSETDEQALQVVSKEPTITVVKEEENEVETPNEKPKRVLRSTSKSPNDPENSKKSKQTSKKTTNQEEQEEQKKQDVIILDDSIEVYASKPASVKKNSRASIKKENLADEVETKKSENGSTPTKKSANLSATEKNLTPSPNRNGADIVSPVKSATKRDSLRKQNTPEQSKSDKGSGKKNKSAEKQKRLSDVKSSTLIFEKIETSQESPSNKNLSKTAAETGIAGLKRNHPEPLKNVAFFEAADENTVKNVYPKTPGLIKSKSYILDASNDVDKDETFKSKKDQSFEEKGTKSGKENSDEEETEGLNTKTPYKLKLMAVESSTPIQSSSPKHNNKTSKIQKQKEKSLMTEEEGVVAFPTSWNKSVSGKIRETPKIDCIISEKSLQEKQTQEKSNKSPSKSFKNSSKNKVHQHDSDVSDSADDMLEQDEFYDEENEQNAERTIFLDDEAIEVADGEESMDSEERAYLEENEVPEYGESIGSQDSDDDDHCDEEPDEEDAAFVVSDTEVIQDDLSSEDEIETSNKSKKLDSSNQKKYKRIYQNLESSDEEANHTANKDETDFYLFVDSSVEEDNIENTKQPGDVKSPMKSFKNKANDSGVKNKSVKNKSLKEDNKLSNSKINKTVQDVSEKENEQEKSKAELPPKILSENDVSKKDMARETVVKNDADIVTQSKPETSEIDDVSQKNEQEPTEKLTKSPKMIIISGDNSDEDDLQKKEQETVSKSPQKKKLTKSPKRKSTATIAQDESENDKQDEIEDEKQCKSTKNFRKSSVNKSIVCDDGFESTNEKSLNKSRKYVSESIDASANEESLNVSQIKSIDNSNPNKNSSFNEEKQNSKSRKSLNESRKSLIRTSTEETNDNLDQSTVEKTKLSLEERFEPEDTLSAHENPLDISAGKSFNKSKNLRKSLDRNSSIVQNEQCNETEKSTRRKSIAQQNTIKNKTESSADSEAESEENLPLNLLKNKQSKEPEKSKRRKSIAQQSLTRKSSESSADSEDENVEKLTSDSFQNKQSNEPEKSKRRKSIAQQSITRKSSESSADSEDENVEKLTPDSLQNKQSNEPEKSKRRKSIAQQSLTRKSSESSADSEDENVEKLTPDSLQNKQSNEPEKSKRRKSIAQQSLTRKSSESSADSEDENVEKLTPDSLQNKQSNEPEKSKRRKSIAQQSLTRKSSESSADSEDENVEKLTPDSLQNKQSNEPEKSKRRKSIAQQSLTQKSSESSAGSEDENVEKLTPDSLQNKQSNKPEKSKRRKSIAQQSITRKDSESSADSEEQNDEKSSAEITDNEMESSHGDEVEAQFSDEENVATNRTISDFLGEEDKIGSPKKHNSSRRKSIVTNESKLDETFQLDPKSSLCSSLHESLHRSIIRKSLNQSQKRKESTEANSSRDNINEEVNFSSNSEELDNSSEEEEFEIKKKIVAEKGLSVSLNSMQIKNRSVKDTKAIRNSFTIGVSVRKNFSEDEDSSEAEHVAENVASSKSENSSSSESKGLNLSEVNCLEKVKDVKNVGPYKSRKSMSNSIVLAPPSDGDINQKKRIKRTSLYLQEEAASNSFVENLAEEKKKINPKKRKSNSFCGAIAPSSAEDADNVPLKEPRSEKKLKKSIESENRDDNLKHVLSRCEQMIEAANEAKLQAKLQAKKVKVKKPKWMAKEEEASKEVETVEIPLVSKKEIKRKEKIKKELAKALKQSACVLSKVNEPVKKVKQKNPTSKLESNMNPTKRLETEFLESLVELSNPNKKKAKEIKTTPPSDKENSKKKSNKLKYRIEDIHTKIESDIETLETACGTVIVEPSTPQKLRFQHGFRESPKTPIGFKIQDIDVRDKKKDLKCSRKLKTPSGAFIEDNITSSKKNNINQQKPRKRKYLQMEEPTYTLPKTQWTPSGVFVEEDLSNARPLANSTATQFLVASLKSGKKNKEVISSTTLNTALSFKKNALQKSKALRQPSREILNVKRREIVNNQF